MGIEVPRFRFGSAVYSRDRDSTIQRQLNNDTPSPADGATSGEYSYIDPQLLRDLSQKRVAAKTFEGGFASKNEGKLTQEDIYLTPCIASGEYANIDSHLQRSQCENDGKLTQEDIYLTPSIASGDYANIDSHLQRSQCENDGKLTQEDIYLTPCIASGEYANIDSHLQRSQCENDGKIN